MEKTLADIIKDKLGDTSEGVVLSAHAKEMLNTYLKHLDEEAVEYGFQSEAGHHENPELRKAFDAGVEWYRQQYREITLKIVEELKNADRGERVPHNLHSPHHDTHL